MKLSIEIKDDLFVFSYELSEQCKLAGQTHMTVSKISFFSSVLQNLEIESAKNTSENRLVGEK